MTFVPFGDAAARAPLPEGADPRAVLEALRAHAGVIDVVVSETHVCVTFAPDIHTADRPGRIGDLAPRGLDETLARAAKKERAGTSPRLHVVRVRYDGPDMGAFGLAPRELVSLHGAREYTVKMIGFLPGFAYLGDVDPRLVAPRRASPRPRVTAGSVAIAGSYTGIYPFASPGGWHLVGTAVDFVAFDAARGATFALGDRVRFEEVPA